MLYGHGQRHKGRCAATFIVPDPVVRKPSQQGQAGLNWLPMMEQISPISIVCQVSWDIKTSHPVPFRTEKSPSTQQQHTDLATPTQLLTVQPRCELPQSQKQHQDLCSKSHRRDVPLHLSPRLCTCRIFVGLCGYLLLLLLLADNQIYWMHL